jgi:tryptophanyl-tRNA synthetase
VAKKIKRAVTDTDNDVRFDVAAKPGVSNLLSILAAATGGDPEQLADDYTQYGPLKSDTADAVVTLLTPIQARYQELIEDRAGTQALLAKGAAKARAQAGPKVTQARDALGLLPRD